MNLFNQAALAHNMLTPRSGFSPMSIGYPEAPQTIPFEGYMGDRAISSSETNAEKQSATEAAERLRKAGIETDPEKALAQEKEKRRALELRMMQLEAKMTSVPADVDEDNDRQVSSPEGSDLESAPQNVSSPVHYRFGIPQRYRSCWE